MNAWLLNQWDRLRNSLWFVPMFGLITSLVLAVVMLNIDAAVRIETIPSMSWAATTGPSARATLSTLAGGLVTMTSVVFSITILVLAQTSAMFGSRLLRSFLDHNITQCTLAVFLGTSLYCFTVLRSVQEIRDGTLFAPHLSVAVGLLAGLISLSLFIFFIHHVSVSIQAQNVVRNVAVELNDAIERLFPEQIGATKNGQESRGTDEQNEDLDKLSASTLIVESTNDGYVQAVNAEDLMETAIERDLVITLLQKPGDFISVGTRLATLQDGHNREADQSDDGENNEKDLAKWMNECFLIGPRRTPRQDVECAINELVEVAVRALSPGINDPHTAISCIDYLGAALVRLAGREMPARVRCDDDGVPRLIASPTAFASLLNAAFNEIRQYGRSSASITARLLETLQVIAAQTARPSDRDAILRQAAMIQRGAEHGLSEKYDLADVQERVRALHKQLEESFQQDVAPTEHGVSDDSQ